LLRRNSRLAEQRRAAQEREAVEQARHEAELAARAAQAKNRRDPDFKPKLMVPQFIAMTPPKIEKAVEKAIKKAK